VVSDWRELRSKHNFLKPSNLLSTTCNRKTVGKSLVNNLQHSKAGHQVLDNRTLQRRLCFPGKAGFDPIYSIYGCGSEGQTGLLKLKTGKSC
jgi:hypothetical protein